MNATGERLIIDCFSSDLEAEHLERYRHACLFAPGKIVLDVACGTGYGTKMLAEAGARNVRGIDASKEAVDYAQQHYRAKHLTFELGNAECLSDISDGSVDLIVSFETIEHLTQVESFLAEVCRVMKQNGQFLMSTPDRRLASSMYPIRGRPNNPYHVKEYTQAELKRTLERHFTILEFAGQAYVSKIWVFWPLQVFLKATCNLFRRFGAYKMIRKIYHLGTGFVVQPSEQHQDATARYWVVRCSKR